MSMRHPTCPICGREFSRREFFRLESMGRRRPVRCPECSFELIWEKRCFQVYVAGIVWTLIGTMVGTAALFNCRLPLPLGAVFGSGLIFGPVLYSVGMGFSKLVRVPR